MKIMDLEKLLKNRLVLFFLIICPAALYAQNIDPAIIFLNSSRFFVAIVAGVILAVTFQMVMTDLSLAAGLNMLKKVTSSDKNSKTEGGQGRGMMKTLHKINNSFGIWALITASIALFFSSWLSVRLSLIPGVTTGAILGLVIAGLFLIVMMTVEASAVSSLVGTLGRTAINATKSTYEALIAPFKTSPEEKIAETMREVTASIREELFGDKKDFQKEIHKYIQEIKPREIPPEEIAKEIMNVLDNTEIKAMGTENGQAMLVSFLEKGGLTKEKASQVKQKFTERASTLKEEAHSEKDTISKGVDMAMEAAGITSEEAESYRQKVENYLRSTHKEALNPEGIKNDLMKLIKSPAAGKEALKARISRIDKSALVALLSKRKDLSEEKANKILNQVESLFHEMTGTAQQMRGDAEARMTATKEKIESKIATYLDSLGKPELRYEFIKEDIKKLFYDPKDGAEDLINRLKSIDRDTLRKIISTRKDMSEEDAEHLINRIEATRDDYINKAQQMKETVKEKVEHAKEETMEKLDETRQIAASAAWWVFFIAIFSSVAAFIGGYLGAIEL